MTPKVTVKVNLDGVRCKPCHNCTWYSHYTPLLLPMHISLCLPLPLLYASGMRQWSGSCPSSLLSPIYSCPSRVGKCVVVSSGLWGGPRKVILNLVSPSRYPRDRLHSGKQHGFTEVACPGGPESWRETDRCSQKPHRTLGLWCFSLHPPLTPSFLLHGIGKVDTSRELGNGKTLWLRRISEPTQGSVPQKTVPKTPVVHNTVLGETRMNVLNF